MYSYYGSMIILIPAMILAMFAQTMVKSSFRKYSKVRNRRNYTGREVASMILSRKDIGFVDVKPVGGVLTDHYDPRNKSVNLSEEVYDKTSLSALAVAAHECGHAIQDDRNYFFLRFRHAILPAVNIASTTAMPLAMLGIFLGALSGVPGIGSLLLKLGIMLFAIVVLFHVVTLPVEFNASRRALIILEEEGFLDSEEIRGAKAVLRSAALTYVASAAVALSNLIRLILLSRRRS